MFSKRKIICTVALVLAAPVAFAVETADVEDITMQVMENSGKGAEMSTRVLALPSTASERAQTQAAGRDGFGLMRANAVRAENGGSGDDSGDVEATSNDKMTEAQEKATEKQAAAQAKADAAQAKADEKLAAAMAKADEKRDAAQARADDAQAKAAEKAAAAQERANDKSAR